MASTHYMTACALLAIPLVLGRTAEARGLEIEFRLPRVEVEPTPAKAPIHREPVREVEPPAKPPNPVGDIVKSGAEEAVKQCIDKWVESGLFSRSNASNLCQPLKTTKQPDLLAPKPSMTKEDAFEKLVGRWSAQITYNNGNTERFTFVFSKKDPNGRGLDNFRFWLYGNHSGPKYEYKIQEVGGSNRFDMSSDSSELLIKIFGESITYVSGDQQAWKNWTPDLWELSFDGVVLKGQVSFNQVTFVREPEVLKLWSGRLTPVGREHNNDLEDWCRRNLVCQYQHSRT